MPTTEVNAPNKEAKDEVLTKNEIKSPRHIQNPPWTEARSYTGQYYIPRVKIGPGKSRFRWSNPFEFLKRLFKFTNRLLTNNGERKELKGLDKGWIKYKPPD